ncbi:MAG: dienelactone hydrolase family protein, partial [Candidatus Nanopelagicaceae bacterium]
PGVVVLQEVFGVNGHIRDIVDRLAQMGYVAIAPALFHRQAPGFDAGYTPQDPELGRGYAGNTTAAQLLEDIQGAIDYLKSLPQVLPNFGCVGFCFGGHVAYLAATLTDIKVTASFYGRGITTFTPGGGPPSVSRTADIKGKIYLFFGDEDQSIPLEHVEEVRAALQQHQILHQIWQYPGAGHGFNCNRRDSYNPTAATDAWQRLTELLLILQPGDAELASFS